MLTFMNRNLFLLPTVYTHLVYAMNFHPPTFYGKLRLGTINL